MRTVWAGTIHPVPGLPTQLLTHPDSPALPAGVRRNQIHLRNAVGMETSHPWRHTFDLMFKSDRLVQTFRL